MLRAIASRLPQRVVRAIGRLQFRSPLAARLIGALSARVAGAGTIRHGAGAGLRFDASGGYPGYLLGTSEPAEQAFVAASLGPGDVFYDVGANIGFYSTIAARLVGPQGRVYAFEPHPESASRAAANAARNGFGNVTVVTAAVGREEGRANLQLASGSASHRLADAPGLEVERVTLDGWAVRSGAPAPTLVMIDVEGAELDVLAGMRGLLAAHRPTICCEVHWLGEPFLDFCARELGALGYELSALEGGPPPTGLVRWHAVLRARAQGP